MSLSFEGEWKLDGAIRKVEVSEVETCATFQPAGLGLDCPVELERAEYSDYVFDQT